MRRESWLCNFGGEMYTRWREQQVQRHESRKMVSKMEMVEGPDVVGHGQKLGNFLSVMRII